MKKILFICLLATFVFGQQINHDLGVTTTGTAYTVSGATIDSSTAVNVVFDLQDFYLSDYNPYVHNSGTALGNSDAFHFGTLWFYLDATSAADSTNLNINVYPGGFILDDNDANRYETTENTFSSTAVTLRDSSATRTLGDIQWSAVSVYLDASNRILPPELIKIEFAVNDPSGSGGTELADGTIYWSLSYPAVYESQQDARRVKRGNKDNKKAQGTLK